jgi:tRNA (cytidine/uridine-2'-O-)-methyltransferase
MCAATGAILHLVEPMGFKITDAKVRRAGLDYWEHVVIRRHASWDAFMADENPARFFLFSTAGESSIFETTFKPGDYFIFGSETRGLADEVLARWPDRVRGIPMRTDHVRSLNLANAVAIVLYEGLRQCQQPP